jgi:hypothetical protein
VSSSLIFSINAARAAACAGVSSARTNAEPAKNATALTADNNLEIRISFSYANSLPDATAFPLDGNSRRHTNGSGLANAERNMMPRTSPRETFMRCPNSATPAVRSFSIVLMPIKIGHAHAMRTRNCPNGTVFV